MTLNNRLERLVRPVAAGGSSWPVIGLLGLILAAGLGLRLKGLTANSLAIDEQFHALLALRPDFIGHYWGDQCRLYVCSHPFLFYLIHKASLALFGPSLLAARLPDLLAGLGVIYLGFLIGRRLSGPGLGLGTAFLMAFNFTLAGYSQMFRPYGLWIFMTTLLIWIGLWLAGKISGPRLALVLVLIPLAQQTAYGSLFVLGGVGLVLVKVFWAEEARKKRRWPWYASYFAVLGATALLFLTFNTWRQENITWSEMDFYQPWVVTNMSPAQALEGALSQFISALDQWLPLVGQREVNSLFIGLSLFVALVGLGRLAGQAQGRNLLWLLAGVLGAEAAAILAGKWTIHWRHSLFLIVFYLILVAQGLAVLGGWLRQKKLYPALALGLVLLALLPVRAVLKEPFLFPGWGTNELVAQLKAGAQEGDALYADLRSSYSLIYLLWADDLDLIYIATEPNNEALRKLRRLEAFGTKMPVILGGPDVTPLVERRPTRIWAIISPNAFKPEIEAAKKGFGPDYEVVKEWTSGHSPTAFWRLYRRVDQ
ncbi:MAG: glycosyltransferase family 39 protein [Deltaproteobacteria bacterium]|nr:glycosyltransferase family 39 protein [Deltaproteobacteria bacterium]